VHSCDVHVPSSVPLGDYCLVVVANGIASACRRVKVAKRWKIVKELKVEIKDKLEIFEQLDQKRLADLVDVKAIRDNDIKAIRENDVFQIIEEEWADKIRTLAESVDTIAEELGRSFIRPEQRPAVGPPEPEIEEVEPRRISEAEAERAQTKHTEIRGRTVEVSKEAQRLHDQIHGHEMGNEGTVRPAEGSRARPPAKAPAKRSATKKSPPPRRP